MQSESTKLRDFSGQNIYVGMDVHYKSWKIHIYSDEFELKSMSQEPAGQLFTKSLSRGQLSAGV